jgi:hypothetical protein
MIESNTILLDAPQHQPPTYFLGILDDVVPVGMAQDVLYLPNYARPDEFLAISVSGEDDVALAPMNARALTVSLRSSNGPEHVQDDLIGPLSAIVPFLNENVFFIEPSQRVAPSFRLTEDVTFKPVRSADKRPLLMKTSKRNLYMLQDAPSMPLELMTAVHIFVAKIA